MTNGDEFESHQEVANSLSQPDFSIFSLIMLLLSTYYCQGYLNTPSFN